MHSPLKSLHLGQFAFDPDNVPGDTPHTPFDPLFDALLNSPQSGTVPNGHAPSIFPAPTSHSGQATLYPPDAGSGGAAIAGGAGTGGTASVTSVATTSSPFVINIAWDASVQSAPAGFTTAIVNAATYLESQFVDPVSVNIAVGYGEVNGAALAGNTLGSTQSYLSSYSYTALRNALSADATSTDDISAAASLPASSPVNGTFWTTTADAKALGLAVTGGTAADAFVGFSSTTPFTYDDSSGVAAGSYDFNGIALHEFTEAMGRILLTGTTVGTTANSYNLMDLFHYASAGVQDFSASAPGYLSADGGSTSIGSFNTNSGGDAGDWAASMGYDAFDAFTSSGVVNPVSANDLRAIDLVGWDRPGASSTASAAAASTVTASAPTGIALAPATAGLAGAHTATGLAATAPLATATQAGGAAGDSYAYTLGGGSAAAFSLATANDAATLAVGAGGLAGAAGGRLYDLTITATDTTTATSAPASPLDVIVGSGAVGVAALTGSLGATVPTFVYGMGGADLLDGTGMTGPLWINGGGGADTLMGGSGANDYLYGATSDSTANAMDVITNFHAGADLIDLTGLGRPLASAGPISGNKLAASSFGWQASGGNTFVYVNTTTARENLAGANMKIELLGSIGLGNSNFAHL
jgi:hypothetical protein